MKVTNSFSYGKEHISLIDTVDHLPFDTRKQCSTPNINKKSEHVVEMTVNVVKMSVIVVKMRGNVVKIKGKCGEN